MCPGCSSVLAIEGLNAERPGPPLADLAESAKLAPQRPAATEPQLHDDNPGDNPDDEPLYAARKKIYPQHVTGTFRRVKWAVLIVTLPASLRFHESRAESRTLAENLSAGLTRQQFVFPLQFPFQFRI